MKEIENDISYWSIDCNCGSKYKWTVYLNDSCYCGECKRLVPAAEPVFTCSNKHKTDEKNSDVVEAKHLCVECGKKVAIVDKSNYDAPISFGTTDANILYNMVVDIAKDSTKKAQTFIYDKIELIKLNNDDKKAWDEILQFSNFKICADDVPVRQDSIIDKSNNQELITYPNKSQFNVQLLRNIGEIETYNINGYLSNLLLISHSLDEIFHKTTESIISQSNIKCKYKAGPVKTMDRCQKKAHDYRYFDFPTTACIVDMNRCALCFDTCQDMIYGLNTLIKSINSGQTCLKKVVRVKNKFLVNKQEFLEQKKNLNSNNNNNYDENEYLYQYADVTLNALLEYDNKSIVVEIQCLLQFMLEAKQMSHKLYQIIRYKDYLNAIYNVMSINSTKQAQLLFTLDEGNDRSSQESLARLLLSFGDEIDLAKASSTSTATPFQIACSSGHHKLLTILLDAAPPDKISEYLCDQGPVKSNTVILILSMIQSKLFLIYKYRIILVVNQYNVQHKKIVLNV